MSQYELNGEKIFMTKEEMNAFQESKKYNYIVTVIVALLSLIFMAICFFAVKGRVEIVSEGQKVVKYLSPYQMFKSHESNSFNYANEKMFMYFWAGSVVLCFIFRMANIKTGLGFLSVFNWIVVIFGVSMLGITLLATSCSSGFSSYSLIIYLSYAGLVFNGFGFLIIGLSIRLFLKIPYIFRSVIGIFNVGYKGKAPISYFGKIVEVFVQVLLLPVSAFIQFFIFTVVGYFINGFIIKDMFYIQLKGERDESYSYNVTPSDTVVTEKVEHDIRDSNGVKIGSYETEESHIEHDNGYRVNDKQEDDARINSFFVLPLRILSLLLSVLALFIPKLYVKVMRPNVEEEYNYKLFRYLDVIAFYPQKEEKEEVPEKVME